MYSSACIALISALVATCTTAAPIANADANAISILPRQVHWNTGSGGVKTGKRDANAALVEKRQVHWNSGSGGVKSKSHLSNNIIYELKISVAGKRDANPEVVPAAKRQVHWNSGGGGVRSK